MAEDINRNGLDAEQSTNITGLVGTALGAAGALSASAAFLHRSGNYAKMSRALNRMRYVKREMRQQTTSKAMHRWTASDYKQRFEMSKKFWNESASQSIQLNTRNPNSFISSLQELEAFKNRSGELRRTFMAGMLRSSATKYYNRHMAVKGATNQNKRFYNFIQSTSRHIDNAHELEDLIKRHNFNEQETQNARALINRMKKLREGKRLHQRANKMAESAINSAQDEFVKRLTKQFKSGKSVDRRTGSRALTVGEVMDNPDFASQQIVGGDKNATISIKKAIENLQSYIEEKHGKEAAAKLRDIHINEDIRIDAKGSLYDDSWKRSFRLSMLDYGANTMPGKIMRLRDAQYDGQGPALYMFQRETYNPAMAAKLGLKGTHIDRDAVSYTHLRAHETR